MVSNTLDFKCALITGGGGGLGRAMAESLLKQGKQVIIAGRTEEKLQKFASEAEGKEIAYYTLDTGSIASIPAFVSRLTKEHPEVDCVINNAGIQRPLDIHDFALDKADQEIDINIRGPMHLIIALLPHLKTKPHATIMNVTSVLGYIPFSIINPVYNGTKAWLHFWTMNLRSQLAAQESSRHIKVVEIVPPTVETDLHRERSDPDDNKKGKNPDALSVDEFMGFVEKGWGGNEETIGAGMAVDVVQKWYGAFGEKYAEAEKK